MVLYTLDGIVRNYLLRKGYPMHNYMQCLVYSAACLRELTLDDLQVVNIKIVTVDPNTGEAPLPNDYVSYVEVGMEAGQGIRPLVEASGLSTLPAYTSDFTQTNYTEGARSSSNSLLVYNYLLPLFWNTVTWNEYGENIGRLFGWGNGGAVDTFVIDKARNVIITNNRLSVARLIIRYISDGQSADAITQIPAEAYDTINKYIAWQMKENSRSYSEGESERARQMYLNARGILRARTNGLTPEVVLRIFQNNYTAAARS